MKHVLILSFRLLLLIVALYAVSNALKELLLREDDPVQATLLVLLNVLIAGVCWSLGCWSSQRAGRRAPISADFGRDGPTSR
ncbi:MAG: hypothetical protein ACXV97_07365 [Chthoniobacterales bacterium]